MSPLVESIRLLFLGCGWATRIHSRSLRRRGDVELFYASRDFDRAVAFRRRYGGRRAYGSYEDALADPRVDVALVATPTRFHREHARLSLAAG